VLKRVFIGSILLILLSSSNAAAQSVCPLNGTPWNTAGSFAVFCPSIELKSKYWCNILNASFGLKYRLLRNLVVSGNVLVKLDDNGLRSTTVPLVGASYNF
jgi:hypothetical protein